ncbi:helix-turn-helix domain-containing protein [Segatella buccae]|uniref:helix-turn-helix domain-containing protein n=1 Tax=Segatella buccae TaxID=28126 RepID=UPI0022E7205F|nr:helix-turn-helix domain-containing protein [Segatella buccae]
METMTQEAANRIAYRVAINTKPILTFDEACLYMGMSKSALYKVTSSKEIPFSKPNGKMIYFKRTDVDGWLLSNMSTTATELADKAMAYTQKKGGKR